MELSAQAKRPRPLEGQRSRREQVLHCVHQPANRMARGSSTKIVAGDVQVDLRAGNQPVTEQVTNGDEADSGADEMSREGVAHAVW